jgi:DNA polymerase-3 subunit beta
VAIELSAGKIRFSIGDVVLTSKLIDGTFPDYARVIPANNDKSLIVDKKDFEAAVDRVSTVSSERGRAVKLSITSGRLVLSVTNPDSGSETEELEVEYEADPLDIGFNSRYLLDIAAQIEGEAAVLKLADPRLAHTDPGQGRQGRALCADADAGLISRIASAGANTKSRYPRATCGVAAGL